MTKLNCTYCGNPAYSDRNICDDCMPRLHENCYQKDKSVLIKDVENMINEHFKNDYIYGIKDSTCVALKKKLKSFKGK